MNRSCFGLLLCFFFQPAFSQDDQLINTSHLCSYYGEKIGSEGSASM